VFIVHAAFVRIKLTMMMMMMIADPGYLAGSEWLEQQLYRILFTLPVV